MLMKVEGLAELDYGAVRDATVALCAGLSPEDCQAQSMADASPVKWHLAHTTWFFEQFVLAHDPQYRPYNAAWVALFNSYYNTAGGQYPRPQRGLLTRPTLDDVRAWRGHIDAAMKEMLARESVPAGTRERVQLGLHHELQHQELLLTDLKHLFSLNPLLPAYRDGALPEQPRPGPARWLERPGVLIDVGHDGHGFAFDHEAPRHRTWVDAHALASRPVTNDEFREFIHDGGYQNPLLWLADGWERAQAEGWERPLYWGPDAETVFTLRGEVELSDDEPVCHLSFFEADAYARWASARLPREEEWEAAAAAWPVEGNFAESGVLHPRATDGDNPGFFGNVWEWTASPYVAYPGYKPAPGALGEYNGKFMCNQFVLRGGSCATPIAQLRASYRNFFPPHARWQFAGLRLARDL